MLGKEMKMGDRYIMKLNAMWDVDNKINYVGQDRDFILEISIQGAG